MKANDARMFTIAEIARATGGKVVGKEEGTVSGVSTDSRTVKAGELFVPLRGERFDGHDYIAAACGRGVGAILAERGWLEGHPLPAGVACITVTDTLRALGDLASFHRNRFDLPVACITGSNGKTTTKEMLAAILAQTGPGLKTEGNLNNLVGVPQMLFRLDSGHRWAVLELGMSEFGEIDRLAELSVPAVGVITNAFPAHLESIGSVQGVARAKGELFLRLPPGGCAVFNADDPLISRCPSPAGVKRLSFGLHGGEVRATAIRNEGRAGQSFTLLLPGGDIRVRLHAFGLHSISNALAAAAAAHVLGVKPELIRSGLESFTPYEKRFQVEEVGGVVLIDDSYNANPASMRAALLTLKEIKEECRGIAVLGDMLELGLSAREAHREMGRLAASCAEQLLLLGGMAEDVAAGALEGGLSADAIFVAGSHGAILERLEGMVLDGDCILVKGSRGMRMETVAEGIRGRRKALERKGALA